MKKALLPITLVTLLSVFIYSRSSDDDDSASKLERSFPIDINGNGWIDITSTLHINRYDEKKELVFYSITNKG